MLVKRMWVLSVLLCCAGSKEAPVVSGADAAASWPRFHGPRGDNISSETGLLKKWRDVGLVEATPEGHKLVSRFQLPEGGKGPTWPHPVVCGGRLYLRHGDLLFGYDVRNRD